MLRFKALNLATRDGEDISDQVPLPTKEAQEAEITELYNAALRHLCDSDKNEATILFEEILQSPLLRDDLEISPLQQQLKLGCLKNLSLIYLNASSCDELPSAERVLSSALKLDADNVVLWIRLGKVYKKAGEYKNAFLAFQQGLRHRPQHWICIENLITLAYVTGDYASCLRYCGVALSIDGGFIRGHVFKDEIAQSLPDIYDACKYLLEESLSDKLSLKINYGSQLKEKFINEAIDLVHHKNSLQLDEDNDTRSLSTIKIELSKLSLLELCRSVLTLHRENVLDLTRSIEFATPSFDESQEAENSEQFQPEEISSSSVSKVKIGDSCNLTKEDTSNAEEGCSKEEEWSEHQSSMGSADEPKRKRNKDVKWWQYEGKRRSQRVRGHLQPLSQASTKSERGFAETLKDLVPGFLLCDNDEATSYDPVLRMPVKDQNKYFGGIPEAEDVKCFIKQYGKASLVSIIVELPAFLANRFFHPQWPSELVALYLELYKLYKMYCKISADWFAVDDVPVDYLRQQVSIELTRMELIVDKCFPDHLKRLQEDKSFGLEVSSLYAAFASHLGLDCVLLSRFHWCYFKYELGLAICGDRAFGAAVHHLKVVERNFLKASKPIQIPTKVDNVISSEEIARKYRFIGKMNNAKEIHELYESGNHTALIEVLEQCLTAEDYTVTDLENRFFLADAYYHKMELSKCVEQLEKLVSPCLKLKCEMFVEKSISLLEDICSDLQTMKNLSAKDKRTIFNTIVRVLAANDAKGFESEVLQVTPWCILHNILFQLETEEPALYMDEEATPSSVILLQFAHEYLNRSNKCNLLNGKLLLHTIKAYAGLQGSSDYSSYDDTKSCVEQAIYCLWQHPSKKSKLKYISDHGTDPVDLSWEHGTLLYNYYKPQELPEFDTYDTINPDTEAVFTKILASIPEEVKPQGGQSVEQLFDDCETEVVKNPEAPKFPGELADIYYLLADHYFKSKDWLKAVEFYTSDLSVLPNRFDSWAAIALAKGEMIGRKLSTGDEILEEDVLKQAKIVVRCFELALTINPQNWKLSVEHGSFVYAMHSFCSRVLKNDASHIHVLQHMSSGFVEQQKTTFLHAAFDSFSALLRACEIPREDGDEESPEETWIHHYMLGKVYEKLEPFNISKFLNQYELAAKRMEEQGAVYPSKINYFNPPELAVEALEIYYRIHASVLSYVRKTTYSIENEMVLLKHLQNAALSPFVISKHSRGNSSLEQRRKVEDIKRIQTDVESVMNDILDKVDELVSNEVTESSSCDSSPDEISPATKSYQNCLPAFSRKKRGSWQELSNSAKKDSDAEGHNKFYNDFAHLEYGRVISKCLCALEECIRRFPQHFKSYFRLALTYYNHGVKPQCYSRCKEYLLGNPNAGKKATNGLFFDRKPNNFFNNVWRNPVDDIDRPGSFPYYMARIVHQMIMILHRLHEYQTLADVGVALSKIPEPDKQYLSNKDRQHYSNRSIKLCVSSARKRLDSIGDLGKEAIRVFETYLKLQKLNAKENPMAVVLQECYKKYLRSFGHIVESDVSFAQTFQFFQHLTWQVKSTPVSTSIKKTGDLGGMLKRPKHSVMKRKIIGNETPLVKDATTPADESDEDAFKTKKPRHSGHHQSTASTSCPEGTPGIIPVQKAINSGDRSCDDKQKAEKSKGKSLLPAASGSPYTHRTMYPSISQTSFTDVKQVKKPGHLDYSTSGMSQKVPPVTVSPANPNVQTLESVPLEVFLGYYKPAPKRISGSSVIEPSNSKKSQILSVSKGNFKPETQTRGSFSVTSESIPAAIELLNKLPVSCTFTNTSIPLSSGDLTATYSTKHLSRIDHIRGSDFRKSNYAHEMHMTTSPFRSQSVALLKPGNCSSSGSIRTRDMTPPPAHSGSTAVPGKVADDEPEIIDLTSPNKATSSVSILNNTSTSANTGSGQYVRSSYPVPPKKNLSARSPVRGHPYIPGAVSGEKHPSKQF